MARRVFYSFHYKPDNWRVSTVRNIGAIEGNRPASDNDWESITKGGDPAIQKWIDAQMDGRSCAIVLIGTGTAQRKWIDYEIKKAWSDRKGVLGIHVHNLKDSLGMQTKKGANPFRHLLLGQKALDTVVKTYDPPYTDSKQVYEYISQNVEGWIEKAIEIRSNN